MHLLLLLAACTQPSSLTDAPADSAGVADSADTGDDTSDSADTSGSGGDSSSGGDPVLLSLTVVDRWGGAPVEGAVLTGLARGSTDTTDATGVGTLEVDASAAFGVTFTAPDRLDAHLRGVMWADDLGFGVAWPTTDVLDGAADAVGVTRDPAKGVVIVSVLDVLFDLTPMSWVSGYELTLSVGSEGTLVADEEGALTPGDATLEGAPGELVFLNVPPGTATLQWGSSPICATEWLMSGPAATAFDVVAGEITFVHLVTDCD